MLADRRQDAQRDVGLLAPRGHVADRARSWPSGSPAAPDRRRTLRTSSGIAARPPTTATPWSDRPERARVVVDQPDDLQTASPDARRMSSSDLRAGVAGPHQEDPRRLLLDAAPAEREESALEADRAGGHHRRPRSRTTITESGIGRCAGSDDHITSPNTPTKLASAGQEHAPRLLDARVAPHLPVETEQVVGEQMDRRRSRGMSDQKYTPVLRRARSRGTAARGASGTRARPP